MTVNWCCVRLVKHMPGNIRPLGCTGHTARQFLFYASMLKCIHCDVLCVLQPSEGPRTCLM
jgi:hypothetical protein